MQTNPIAILESEIIEIRKSCYLIQFSQSAFRVTKVQKNEQICVQLFSTAKTQSKDLTIEPFERKVLKELEY